MFQRHRDVLVEIGAKLADHPSVLQAIAYGSKIGGEERALIRTSILSLAWQRRTLRSRTRFETCFTGTNWRAGGPFRWRS